MQVRIPSIISICLHHFLLLNCKVLRIKLIERMMPFTTNRSIQYLDKVEQDAELYNRLLGKLNEATQTIERIPIAKVHTIFTNRRANLFLRPMGRKRSYHV